MAQESRVQNAMQEQERQFGRMTRSISGAVDGSLLVCILIWKHLEATTLWQISDQDLIGGSQMPSMMAGLPWRPLDQSKQQEPDADGTS